VTLKLVTDAPTVLIVDDEPDERFLMRQGLESAGLRVHEANSGRDAFKILSQFTPSAILLDVLMPEMDGIDVCSELRSKKAYRDVPVLMLTGMDNIEYVQRAFDAGATDFITKSTNPHFVAQRVLYALRNSRLSIDLTKNHHQLKQVQRVAKIGYWQLSLSDNYLVLSDDALKIFFVTRNEFDNSLAMFLDLVHLGDRDGVKAAIEDALYRGGKLNVDHRIVRKDGRERYVNSQGEVVYGESGQPLSMLGVVQDIDERKRTEATMLHHALYDSLTDLSNRRLFQDRLKHAMIAARREEKLLAVCFFDLDNFKMINDNLGHAVGDELLKSVANRLRSTMRQGDIIARISGDEFAVAIEGLSTVEELEKIVEKLRARLSEPYRIRGHKVYASASIGMSLYPLDSSDRDAMLRNADAAMYRAKELGGNSYCYYTFDMNDKARRRLEMENQLRKALGNNELCLYYQPQVDAVSLKIIGMEALLRWQHQDYGLLAPSKFLPIAEECGLVYPIGVWVINTALTQLAHWHNSGYEGLRLAINMSSRQLSQEENINAISQVVQRTGLNPNLVCIEITESVAMKNLASTLDRLQQLKEIGVDIVLDDYGAGHSSMNLLQRLPIDCLNIDRSFVMKIAGREQDGNAAKGIIALAHGLGLRVTAEGVETKTQFNFLRANHCDELQGYYFSPPLPVDQVNDVLKKNNNKETLIETVFAV